MGQLIDLCGTPIQVDKISDVRLIKREWLFYPAYQETEATVFSVFARFGEKNKKKFKFVKMVPFGALLSDKEKPANGGYAIKSFGEAAALNALNIISETGKAIENVAHTVADLFRIDTSGNKEFRILTQARRLTNIKLRDVPAKVMFLSGKVGDVYKNDPVYAFLGEPIAPTIATVPTLVVTVDKMTYVFFGGGIDLENAEEVYHQLFEVYKNLHEKAEKKNTAFALPKIVLNFPKLTLPSIKLQSPFVRTSKESDGSKTADSTEKRPDLPSGD